jgi:hypothetical protein
LELEKQVVFQMKFFFLPVLCILFSFKTGYGQQQLYSLSNDLENISDSSLWINLFTVVKGDAHSGNSFSSTDSTKHFGLGYKGKFPETCRNKSLRLSFSEYVRTQKTGTNFFIVITLSLGDSIVLWDSKNISSKIKVSNSWTRLSDDIEFPSTVTGSEFTLSIFLWNDDGKSVVDIDDFKMDFFEKKTPSFLPTDSAPISLKGEWKKIFSNKSILFFYDNVNGQILFFECFW